MVLQCRILLLVVRIAGDVFCRVDIDVCMRGDRYATGVREHPGTRCTRCMSMGLSANVPVRVVVSCCKKSCPAHALCKPVPAVPVSCTQIRTRKPRRARDPDIPSTPAQTTAAPWKHSLLCFISVVSAQGKQDCSDHESNKSETTNNASSNSARMVAVRCRCNRRDDESG